MSEDKDLVVKKPVPMTERGVQLTDMDALWKFAGALVASGAVPTVGKGQKMDQATVFAMVQAGLEFGLTPMASLTNMKCINGRTGPMGKIAKGKVLSSGMVKGGIRDGMVGKYGDADYRCVVVSTRADDGVEVETSFSVRDAKRAGLWGKSGPWSEYPDQMLYYRALGFHLDKVYPDVMMGVVIAEALQDYPVDEPATTLVPLEKPENDPILDMLVEEVKVEEEDVMEKMKQAAILEKLEAEDAQPDNAATEGQEVQEELL